MASLSLSGGEEEFGWRITGLGSAFNQANGYVEAGITKYQFTHSSSSISGWNVLAGRFRYGYGGKPGGAEAGRLGLVFCDPGRASGADLRL